MRLVFRAIKIVFCSLLVILFIVLGLLYLYDVATNHWYLRKYPEAAKYCQVYDEHGSVRSPKVFREVGPISAVPPEQVFELVLSGAAQHLKTACMGVLKNYLMGQRDDRASTFLLDLVKSGESNLDVFAFSILMSLLEQNALSESMVDRLLEYAEQALRHSELKQIKRGLDIHVAIDGIKALPLSIPFLESSRTVEINRHSRVSLHYPDGTIENRVSKYIEMWAGATIRRLQDETGDQLPSWLQGVRVYNSDVRDIIDRLSEGHGEDMHNKNGHLSPQAGQMP